MTIDGGLRPLFRKKLVVGWHWQSIETGGTGMGIPDSNYCYAMNDPSREGKIIGVEGWVEFKHTSAWKVTFQPEQPGWILTRTRRGGAVHVAVRRKHGGGPRIGDPVDELWLYSGEKVRILREHGLRVADPCGYWSGGPEKWNWQEIANTLLARN